MNGKAMSLAKAFGYLYTDEVDLLQELSSGLAAGAVVVNIGAGAGTSGLAIIEANPGVELTTIDISEGGPLGGLQNEKNAFSGAGMELKHRQILSGSIEAASSFDDNSIDMLIIDDDHTEAYLRREIVAWLPKVRAGGLIGFHDYDAINWAGVKRAVDELMEGHKPAREAATYKFFLKSVPPAEV